MRFPSTLLLLALFWQQTTYALDCPANTECIEVQKSEWCHFTSPNCLYPTQQICADYTEALQHLPVTGENSWEGQLAVKNIPTYICANYYVSGTATPAGPEHGILGAPGYEVQKQQNWTLHMLESGGGSDDIVNSLFARRRISCPSGFSGPVTYTVSGAQHMRCERARVPVCEQNCPTSNPVVPFSQEKRLTVSDFSSSGFELVRYYNSQSRHLPSGGNTAMFGPKWSSTWNASLIVDGADEVRSLRADGTQISFKLVGGVWSAWDGEPTTLTYIGGSPPDMAMWKLRDRNDTLESYDIDGRLLAVEHRDGRKFALSYDPVGRLATVQARDGRSISFDTSNLGGDIRVSSALLPDGTTITYGYEGSAHVLKTVSDDAGLRATYLYNDTGSTYTGIDKSFLLTGILDPTGQRHSTYKYDSSGLVSESGLAGGAGVSTFSTGSNYVDITSPTGIERRVFTLTAGAQRVTQVTRRTCPTCSPSMTRSYSYDSNGYVNLETDFNGNTTDHDYNARGLESVRIEAQGKDGRPTEVVSEERKVESDWLASFRVPTERRVFRCSAPNSTAQACSSAGSTRWEIESLSRYAYNARGQVTARCEVNPGNANAMAYACGSSTNAPTGVRQSMTSYCEAADVAVPGSTCPLLGLVKSVDGARTDLPDETVYDYYESDSNWCGACSFHRVYSKGDLRKVTNALGQVTEYVSYDGAGRVKRTKDANGVITDLTYHARGWLQTRTVRANSNGTPNTALDAVTTLTYDDMGQVTQIDQPDGAFIHYAYDDAHRLTGITDNLGNQVAYTLDAAGNRTVENTLNSSNALTRTLGRVYDSLGRLQQQLNAQNAATSFTYDANGNQDTVTDALTRVTDSDVDPLNRLIESTDALMGDTKYRYDARDNLIQVTDAKNLSTGYSYDGLNDLVQLTSPDTGTATYTYDDAGNRATQTDARGVVSTYSYDGLNRLTGISYPNDAGVSFSYDEVHSRCGEDEYFAVGRLTGFTDETGQTMLCYDLRGNIKRKIFDDGNEFRTTRWLYNNADRVTSLTYPSGMSVVYGRDAMGRIQRVEVLPDGIEVELEGVTRPDHRLLIRNVTYYPFGPVKQITWGNGATTQRTYDQNYWIDKIDSSESTGLDLDFTLDAVGNITGISDVISGTPPNNAYTYDALYRLVDVDAGASNVETYTYDAIGNRLSKVVGASASVPYVYPTNSHRLGSVGGVARAYDDNGNTLAPDTAGDVFFAYNERNRLKQKLDSGSAALITYSYNARGERVMKYDEIDRPNRHIFGYDESGRLLVDAHMGDGGMQEFIWLDDLPVGVFADGVLHHIQADHLGSPRKVINASLQTAIWDWPILDNPFGETAPNEDPDGDSVPFTMNLRFPGQYFDVETGLHYNYFRDYEPGTGRYVESDPIGLEGGVTTYSYVNSHPLDSYDPTGEYAIALPLPLAGGSAGAGGLCLPCGAAGVGGAIVGTAIYSTFDTAIVDAMIRVAKGKWTCTSSCNVQKIEPLACCPPRTTGVGFGSNQNEACRNAKRDATQSTPRGCYSRHCQCQCSKT